MEKGGVGVTIEMEVGEASETFSLEKAVCSHGLFMMAPNRWDPLTRTFSRPLRLTLNHLDESDDDSVIVTISQPSPSSSSSSLHVRVHGVASLSPGQEQAVLSQVRRMLRLSETDESDVREFLCLSAKHEDALSFGSFSGRVFRSPTLFEDMVKCILLCNCQWSRTLTMARALCKLQLELSTGASNLSATPQPKSQLLAPKTPELRESKRKRVVKRQSNNACTNLMDRLQDITKEMDVECTQISNSLPASEMANNECGSCQAPDPQSNSFDIIGNFPSPRELASLDEAFLAKRCNLGYRAGRILKLSKQIVDGKVHLGELENLYDRQCLASYTNLKEQLMEIDGFGPFTCANVLMCMGFYHVIPTDSETIRHLKQVHGKVSSIQTVQRDVEVIYGKYAPYQFLAYWAELWNFYEQRFGKLSVMPCPDYKLITASNMKTKRKRGSPLL